MRIVSREEWKANYREYDCIENEYIAFVRYLPRDLEKYLQM